MSSSFVKLCSLFTVLLFCLLNPIKAQDCACVIQEVLENTVNQCTAVTGEIVNVASTEELWAAFIQSNEQGGNMTILIEDGIYEVASSTNYPFLTGSNMVIRSASGNRDACVLSGQGMVDVAPATETCLSLQGDNITVADLTIRNVGNHGISMIGDGNLLHNIKFQDCFEQMVKGNNVGDGADNCILQCCYFEYTAGLGPQWYIGGIDIHAGNNWIVRDNFFSGISSPSNQEAEHAVHFWQESGDNIVERNVIVNCDRGIGFGLGSSPNSGGVIRNNFIYNDGQSIFHDVGIGLESSPNTEVYNNTIHIEYTNAIEYRFEATSDVQIRNNLCNRPITSRDGGSGSLSNNYEEALADWYADPSAGNLRLVNLIPEVWDMGVELDEVSNDIDQNPRDGIPDLGAHEYFLSSHTAEFSPQFAFYPNPSAGIITFNFNPLETGNLFLVDVNHKVVMTVDTPGNKDVSSLTSGIYFISDKGINKNQKLLILK